MVAVYKQVTGVLSFTTALSGKKIRWCLIIIKINPIEHTTAMADEGGDDVKSAQTEICRLPDLCSSMAGMSYNQLDTDVHHHKLNNLWQGLQNVTPQQANTAVNVTQDQMPQSICEYITVPPLKSACRVSDESQFQTWFSQHMLAVYGLQDKTTTCKNNFISQNVVETNTNQSFFGSESSPTTNTCNNQVTFRSETPTGLDTSSINYQCKTPDLLMSVMQFENQALNSRSASLWLTPANSPATSPWPSPDSHHHDSDYYSEEPSPQFYCHPQTSETCSNTNMKIPSFVPTFLPNSNSWNWFVQNNSNQKISDPINPPKIQRLVKGDFSSKSQQPNGCLYTTPAPSIMLNSDQNMLDMTHYIQSGGGPVVSSIEVTPKQFQTKAKGTKSNSQKRKATSPKTSKDNEVPQKKSRHNEPLNNKAVLVMMHWYEEHWKNPYPTKNQKEQLAKEGGISVTQVKSWFANKRNRTNNTRPKVQKKQMEEKLLDICQTLARDSKQPNASNAYIINQLSSIINTHTSSSMSTTNN